MITRLRQLISRSESTRWVSLTLVTRVLTLGLNFAAGVLLARYLGPEGRGSYALLVLLPDLAASLGGLGFHEAVTYHSALGRFRPSAIAGTAIAVALVLGLIYGPILAVIFMAGDFPNPPFHPEVLLLALAAIPLLRAFQLLLAFLRGRQDFAAFNGLLALRQGANLLGLLLALVVFELHLKGAVATYLAVTVLVVICVALRSRRQAGGPLTLDRGFLGAGLGFGFRVWPGTVALFLSRRIDFLILPLMAGTVALGHYAVATQVAEVALIVPVAIATVLMPRATRSGDNSTKLLNRWLRIQLAYSALVVLGILLVGRPLLRILFGSRFLDSYPLLLALLPGLVAMGLSTVLASHLAGTGRPMQNTLAAVAGLACGIPAYLILIPSLGALGAALGSSVAYTGQFLVQWVLHRRSGAPAPTGPSR